MKQHKHAEFVKKFVDGDEIQMRSGYHDRTGLIPRTWVPVTMLHTFDSYSTWEFRVKPKPKIKYVVLAKYSPPLVGCHLVLVDNDEDKIRERLINSKLVAMSKMVEIEYFDEE